MAESPTSVPVVMDLGDFTPEEQEVRFSIAGRPYLVRFAEATVDEVFAMIASEPEGAPGKDRIEKHRKIVTKFLQDHLADGDKEKLAEDLKMLPYASFQGKLCIADLYDRIQLRVKKNPTPGANETAARP